MATKVLRINKVTEDVDTLTGQIVFVAHVQELEPQALNIKLKKLSAARINEIKQLEGKTCVCPVKFGLFNGEPWMNFDEVGQFYVLPPNVAAVNAPSVKSV